MSRPLPCRVCGDDESDHHEFDPVVLPKGCVCDWQDWGVTPQFIPDVCDAFEKNGDPSPLCSTCEHEPGCHAEPPK
jgi:hypothetical protein